jgi:hypothetical protein
MGKLSNIFGVIALVLAGGAAFLSFTIAQRRAEFRMRADKLASTVADTVKAIDADSGTSLSTTVSFTPGDPKAKTPESGTLGWKSFHEAKDDSGSYQAFQSKLTMALGQAQALVGQRNRLAAALSESAAALDLPADQLDVASLRNLADEDVAAAALKTVQDHVTAVAARDDALIDAVSKAATGMGESINTTALTTRQQSRDADDQPVLGEYPYQDVLNGFVSNVTVMSKQSKTYGDALSEAFSAIKSHDGVFSWSTSARSVRSKTGYERAITQMINDFRELNKQLDSYVAAKEQISEQKAQIASLETDLESAKAKTDETELARKALENELTLLKVKYDINDGGIAAGGGDKNRNWRQDIEGKILSVNNDFNYVILNIGANLQMEEGTEMLVARDDKLVAKIQIARVLSQISVADILPFADTGGVKENDRVIMPSIQQ